MIPDDSNITLKLFTTKRVNIDEQPALFPNLWTQNNPKRVDMPLIAIN